MRRLFHDLKHAAFAGAAAMTITAGICGPMPRYAYASAEGDAQFNGVPAQSPGRGVEVLDRSEVGPYDSVELRGTDPQAVRTWLVENGYRVTDEMMESVTPYVAK